MKKKLKIILLLTFSLLFLYNCDVEKEFFEAENHSHYHLKKISYDEFKTKGTIFDIFKKVSKNNISNSNLSRIEYNAQLNLYYDVDEIVLIETQGYKSYTIPIINDSTDVGLKNLIIYEKTAQPVQVKMITYDITEQEISQIRNGELVNVSGKTSSQTLSDISSVSWYDDSGCLVTATTTITAGNMCAQGLHSFGQSCDLTGSQAATPAKIVTRYSYALCSVDGSGGGIDNTPIDSSPGGGSDGSSTGDGSSTTTNPNQDEEQEVITTPVTPGLDGNEPVKTPCSELKTNSLNTDFKTKMQSLFSNVSGTNEKNFRILNGSLLTPPRTNPYCGEVQTGTAQESGTIQYVSALKALAHNHLQDAIHNHIGTFSPLDILQLNNIAIMAENNGSLVTKEEFASYLVCKEGNYSIKINDIDKLYNFATKYANDNEFFLKINKFYEENNMLHGKDKQLQNIGFLKLLKDFDLGIDYYEADSNFENWKKLELNNEQTDINETPC